MADKKIPLSVEPWDSILGTNRPNGTSRTWNFQETGTPSILHTITDDLLNSSPEEVFHNTTLFMSSDDFHKVEIHEIEDQKHLYVIRVLNHQYFRLNLNIGFSVLSPKVLVDVKEGKARIIIEMTSEGLYFAHAGTEFSVIERWRIKEGLPPHSVTVLSGNLLCQKIIQEADLKLNAYPISSFEGFFPLSDEQRDASKLIDYIPCDDANIFLSYNRAQRLHRAYLVAKLNENNLLKRGLISYQISEADLSRLAPNLYDREKWRKLKLLGPKLIDSDQQLNLAQNTNIAHYERTFLSIVTETTINPGCIFFSEKVFKPMAFGHPFLLLGNPFSLDKLKEMGYKTFDKWFDESYDKEVDEFKRTELIVKEVIKLKNLTPEKLISIREDMKDVLLHNKRHYLEQSALKFKHRYFLPVVEEIKNEWEALCKSPKLI